MPLPLDETQTSSNDNKTARKLFWASAGFYTLIAFEFFYMASPFGVYFYSVYGPGLDGLQNFGLSGWTIWFFLPHLVEETRSPLVNVAQNLGVALFFGGLLGFAVGAFQVYRAKLKRTEAVMGGLYRHIRHPQYLALMVASVGMLLVWPRFLVLFSTGFVCLAYIWLAKTEEKICLNQYDGYANYLGRTGRFIPKGWFPFSGPNLESKPGRFAFNTALFFGCMALATMVAFGIRHHTVNALYTYETNKGVYLSIVALEDAELQSIAEIASASPQAKARLEMLSADDRFLAYVLPTQMFISEIPMNLPEGERFGHTVPKNRDLDRYKVVYTRAVFPASGLPKGGNIIANAVNKYPLIEVQVNLKEKSIEAIFQPPENSFYPDVQVPLF